MNSLNMTKCYMINNAIADIVMLITTNKYTLSGVLLNSYLSWEWKAITGQSTKQDTDFVLRFVEHGKLMTTSFTYT
jgi:hypothetical protein